MAAFHNITTAQLRQVLALRERIEFLQARLASIRGETVPAPTKRKAGRPKDKRTVFPKARAKIGAAQKAWWAKTKA